MRKKIQLTLIYFLLSVVYSFSQVVQTVNVPQAGGLAAVIGDNKTKVTDLILTGTINATDFTTIKQMTALKNLDMSQVKIDNNTIPDQAFQNRVLESIILPEGLKVLGISSFAGAKLQRLVLPKSLEVIGFKSFENSVITEGLQTHSKLNLIGSLAFNGMKGNIDLRGSHASLKTICQRVFNDHIGTDTLDFSLFTVLTDFQSATASGTFTGYKGHVILPLNLEELPTFTFTRFTGSVDLPEGLKVLGISSFTEANMKRLVLPKSLEIIGFRSFENSVIEEGLQTHSKLNLIGSFAFSGMKGNIDLSESHTSLKTICQRVFLDHIGTDTLDFSSFTVLTDFQSATASGTFTGYKGHVILPLNLEELPTFTFTRFTGSVDLPEGLKVLGISSFTEANMKRLVLPKSLEIIGFRSFENSVIEEGLQTHSKLNLIGSFAFSGMKGNIDLSESHTSLKTICQRVFLDHIGTDTLDFSSFTVLTDFQSATASGTFTGYKGHVILPNNLEVLPAFLFTSFKGTVSLPSGLKSIGNNAFEASTLKKIDLPSMVTTIGASAFYNCTALDTIISRNGIPPTLGANVFLNVNKETTQLIVPESAINLYGIAAQWKDFLNVKSTLPSQLSLLYRIGKIHITGGVDGGLNSYEEGAIEAAYEAVRIGEYYWMNTNFNHVEPFRKYWASTVSGDEVHFPLTQSVIDKYLGIINIDKSQYQIDIDQFTKDFGVYYSSYSRTYMSTWGKIYENSSTENNPLWNIPSLVDFRQLVGMSDFRHYIAKNDTLESRDVLYTFGAKRNTNEMSQYVLTTGCLDHTGQAYTTTDWYGLNGVTNKYGFNLMQGGARFNRVNSSIDETWGTANCDGSALKVHWAQTGDLYHHLYATQLAAKEGKYSLHDYTDTYPIATAHWIHMRWCRPLTDEELGYKLYINIPNLDKSSNEWKSLTSGNEIPLLIKYRYSDLDRNAVSIIKLGLNENAPEGYIELPKGYIRGFYVNLAIDKVSSEIDLGRIISLACQVDDGVLKSAAPATTTRSLVSDEVSIPFRAESSVSVYPNPATDVLNVSGEGVESVSVYDMSGRQVATANSSSISVSDLNAGTYIVKVKTTAGESTHKVMKK